MLSLALPWILVAFSTLAVREILLLQAVAFLALAMLLCLPPVRVALMPRAARRAVAYRAAPSSSWPRDRAQEGPRRHPDLRFADGALCPHHRRRGHRGPRGAIRNGRAPSMP
jgi:hypothetical protein